MKLLLLALSLLAVAPAQGENNVDPAAPPSAGSKREIMSALGASACEHILSGKLCDNFAPEDKMQQKMVHGHAKQHLRGETERANLEICKKVSLVLEKTREKPEGVSIADHCLKIFDSPTGDAHKVLKDHVIGGKVKQEL